MRGERRARAGDVMSMRSWLAVSLGLAALVAAGPARAQAVLGVDVSRYQGRVDYPKLKAAGYSYCFIKATQGTSYVDPRYASDLAQARAAGLAPGSYHFFVTGDAGAEQFQNFSAQVRLAPGDLPPVIDIEQLSGVGPELVVELRALLDLLESHYQVTPILYSGLQFANAHLAGFERYPLWVAEYEVPEPRVPRHFAQWTFWQYSAHGRVDGIDDEVDLDRFFGTPEQFRALVVAVEPPPSAQPAPSTAAAHSPHFTPAPAPAPVPAAEPRDAPLRASSLGVSWLWYALLALCCVGFVAWRRARRRRAHDVAPAATPAVHVASEAPAEPAVIAEPAASPAATEVAAAEVAATDVAAAGVAVVDTSPERVEPTPFERWTRALATSAPSELEQRLDAIHALARSAHRTDSERPGVVSALSRFVKERVERASAGEPLAAQRPRALAPDLEMALCRLMELGGLALPGVDLHGAHLERAALEHAELSGANLAGANLQGASLRGARLFGANLQGAFLQGAALDGASLAGAFLGGAFLAGASLGEATLQGAFLQSANLPGADLRGANLSGALAPGAHLPGARLADANLSGSNLQNANLQGADLQSARLDRANLSGTRLEGARLSGANLEAALGMAPPRPPAAGAPVPRALD